MQLTIPHDWLYPPNIKAATAIQRELASQVILVDDFANLQHIGGMDVSNNPRDPKQLIYAALVTLDANNFQLLDKTTAQLHQKFPYVPGYLGFREAPALVEVVKKIKVLPDLIMVDGHGISHPRGLGIATHIGVLLNCPTIGVAKSILVGHAEGELGAEPGSQVPLIRRNQQIATLLRTKKNANPLIISTGHRISLSTAVTLVQQSLRGYRLPEPTRQAHLAANYYRCECL